MGQKARWTFFFFTALAFQVRKAHVVSYFMGGPLFNIHSNNKLQIDQLKQAYFTTKIDQRTPISV